MIDRADRADFRLGAAQQADSANKTQYLKAPTVLTLILIL